MRESAREIGIRTALGALRGQVVRLFFAKGLALSVVGLFRGLPLSIIVTERLNLTLRAAAALYIAGNHVLGWMLASVSVVHHALVYATGNKLLERRHRHARGALRA